MPIYEYACTACGERTEAKQSFDDPPLQTCSHCGGRLRKLYSPVGIVFKGSGFYSTDGRKAARSPEGDKKKVETPKKEPKKETKDSTKPDKSEKSA